MLEVITSKIALDYRSKIDIQDARAAILTRALAPLEVLSIRAGGRVGAASIGVDSRSRLATSSRLNTVVESPVVIESCVVGGGSRDSGDKIGHGHLNLQLDNVGERMELHVDERVLQRHHAWAQVSRCPMIAPG